MLKLRKYFDNGEMIIFYGLILSLFFCFVYNRDTIRALKIETQEIKAGHIRQQMDMAQHFEYGKRPHKHRYDTGWDDHAPTW